MILTIIVIVLYSLEAEDATVKVFESPCEGTVRICGAAPRTLVV